MGLKQKLHNYLKEHESMSLDDLAFLCKQWGYKTATAERILRPSESPEVKHIMKNNAIIGYKWSSKAEITDNVKDFLNKWGTQNKTERKGLW